MTNRERVVVLTIFVSVLGISFVSALRPVINSYIYNPTNLVSSYSVNNSVIRVDSIHFESKVEEDSKIVNMLSEVLGIEKDDIQLALDGGSKPSEFLASSGILLSDISEEYSFDIVGDGLVKFRV
ncbi:hypothetical protein A2400_02295 [candidate division WS6 bacterium RIFOXYB1_FULL_33_14]|uniref:Uncharacterized protein n=1 Tax=candidate division WS6 bacterium RIFOXYB1_FULL_33_14 TaxID=1817896 RepID=A0A1F4UGW6_9BACT|nr:MAG: hypothetical protein A2400_02295 [candidate division WS6 bacterium RIFOXYB1_FULL_33_14]